MQEIIKNRFKEDPEEAQLALAWRQETERAWEREKEREIVEEWEREWARQGKISSDLETLPLLL